MNTKISHIFFSLTFSSGAIKFTPLTTCINFKSNFEILYRGDIMKTKSFKSFLIILILFPLFVYAQDISVHKMIGKSATKVIQTYGKPVHQDNTDPAMICMFYQTQTKRMIFVSNNSGVYQAEATAIYNTGSSAREELDKLISGSIIVGFIPDTISTNDFFLHKTGVKVDLQLKENKITKNFEISLKARKSED